MKCETLLTFTSPISRKHDGIRVMADVSATYANLR